MPQEPDKVIEIDGYGSVAFPSSMTPDQINAAAAKLYREKNPTKAPKPQKTWFQSAVDWLPTAGGAIGGALGGVPGAAMGGAAGEGMKQTALHAAELPGAVSDVARNLVDHPRETMGGFAQGAWQGTKDAALAGTVQGLSQGAGELFTAGLQKAGPALMQSALKPAYKMVEKAVKNQELPRVVKTLLDEGVNVTQGGIGKLNTLLSSTSKELDDIISKSVGKVYPEQVEAVGQGVIDAAGQQVAPMADKAAAASVVDEFARVHGGAPVRPMKPMSVQDAQALKQGTYKAIGQRAYGETRGAALEAEKALARGLKEGIEAVEPGVRGPNARIGALIEAKDAIAKRVGIAGNRDPGGIGWVADNPKSFVAFLLARSPAVKSMLARGLYQSASRASGIPENVIRAGVQALVSSEDDQ